MNPLLSTLRGMTGLTTKANEAMATTQANAGAEFDFASYVPRILEKVRQEEFLYARLAAENVHALPSATSTIFLEGDDPTFYPATENDDEPTAAGPYTSSRAGTADATITAKKAACRVTISSEMLEDNVTDQDFEQYVISKISKAFPRTLDTYLINGDTETGTTNVNNDGASASATSAYIQHDGLIKAAIANSATVNGGTLDTGDLRAARSAMGLRGKNPSELVAMMDTSTYYKLLNLGQVETVEKFGARATIVDGVLRAIDGVQVVPTDIMALAASNGKVSSTSGNNTLGRILLVHLPSVHIGFRRQLTIKPYKDDKNDQVGLIATFRYGQVLPYAATSGAKAQSLIYNITV